MGLASTQPWRSAGAAGCAVAVALLLGAGAASAAPAAEGDPWLADLTARLQKAPVAVSDSVTRAVSPAEVAQLRTVLRAMPFPTRVAILSGPPNNLDVPGPSLAELPEVLGGALDRRGLYVVSDGREGVELAAVGVRPAVAPAEVERAVRDDVRSQTRPVARIRYALRVATTGERPLEGVAKRELDADLARLDSNDREDAVTLWSLGGGGLAGCAIPTLLWWRRRPRRSAPARPRHVVREPGPEATTAANAALERLAARIAAAEHPSDEAFELYNAAAKADRDARNPIDHVGVLVLAEDGEAALGGKPRRRRCFFDPAHGGPTHHTRWRLGGEEAEVPACARCAEALREDRAPDALGDRGTPYYERDSVWARTGFGAIDDELAATVLAGR